MTNKLETQLNLPGMELESKENAPKKKMGLVKKTLLGIVALSGLGLVSAAGYVANEAYEYNRFTQIIQKNCDNLYEKGVTINVDGTNFNINGSDFQDANGKHYKIEKINGKNTYVEVPHK